MSAVSDVIAGLNSDLRKKILLGNELSYDKQPLASINMTKALNGGLPYGRQVLIYGSKSSAKSSLMLQTVAMAQLEGKVCAWIDAEMSFDNEWASRLGVDTSQLIVSEARTVNDMVEVATSLMKAGADFIVVDSITSLLPAVYFEKNEQMKELDDTGQMGQEAKDFSRACKMLNYANNRTKPTLLVLISQTRQNLKAYGMMQPTGGNAVKFYSSVVIKLLTNESESAALTSDIKVGNKLIQQNVGRKIDWLIPFSKTSPAFEGGEYNFYYRGDKIGIDKEGELLTAALKYGIITKAEGGGWYTIEGTKIQGEQNAADYLRLHPEIADEVERKITGE